MVTARELLDQAAALMQRNRTDAVDDDIPVLTDAVPLSGDDPLDAPDLAEGEGHAVPELQNAVPILTESVAARAVKHDVVAEGGEPSAWLEHGNVEPSVIGGGPDSVAIVPPLAVRLGRDEELQESSERAETASMSPLESDFDEDMGVGTHPATTSAPPDPAIPPMDAARPPGTRHADSVIRAGDDAKGDRAPFDLAFLTDEFDPAPLAEDEGRLSRRGEDSGMPSGQMAPQETDRGADVVPADPALVPESVEDAANAALIAATFAATTPMVGSAPTAREMTPEAAAEKARWDAIAVEIRMQVLQRIDLFTDTGLREQLGAQLKPIVDRASADLVATINLHVGELLRAYVAEAIEREIETWRRDN